MDEQAARDMVARIDANVAELMADGKLATAKYAAGGGGPSCDRSAAVAALLAARKVYQDLLDRRGVWEVSTYVDR